MLRSWSLGFNTPFWETVQHVTLSLNRLPLFHSKTVPSRGPCRLVLFWSEFQLAIHARLWPVSGRGGCAGVCPARGPRRAV